VIPPFVVVFVVVFSLYERTGHNQHQRRKDCPVQWQELSRCSREDLGKSEFGNYTSPANKQASKVNTGVIVDETLLNI
jgi:hypothetical protein